MARRRPFGPSSRQTVRLAAGPVVDYVMVFQKDDDEGWKIRRLTLSAR